MMDLIHLRSFTEVAERGTIAAAAAAQGYTAPAVSQHLAKLEAALTEPLFDRVGGRLALTDAGRSLLPVAFEMLDLDAKGRAAVAAPAALAHVVFAGFASAIATVLLPRLEQIQRIATVEITEAEDDEALRDLGLGAVDVVLTQEYEGSPSERNRRFSFTPLVHDQLVLVMPPGGSTKTTIGELEGSPWLLNGRGTRCAAATSQILDGAGIAPRVVARVADNTTLLALVAAGHGVTVVPSRVLVDQRESLTIAEQDLGMTRTILAVTRAATAPGLERILEHLKPDNLVR